ncbi:MAG: glycoside hydrolase family 3 N-terminal domain-containing protein [Bacteroidota bacterium]|nr:glycoside hydrolase family 3 N-terminal domain-containing protein [Bacteroidota bacterium]MDP4225344.1 glycoside hydrolase family 3 N-terminal domain-containing protein [Bacteroidota bacterium]
MVSCKKIPVTQEAFYNYKADSLLKLMTLDEKVGQLNLLTSDWSVTGPSINKNYFNLIKEGKVGAIFNAYTVDYITRLQKAAVENTRLHIPLFFGYDVIHGHRTIFPIPLGQAASWDLDMIEQSERIAAVEASAEGINWTFAPMVDIARDPRWGRVSEGAGEDTWLGCRIAERRVKGFQGNDLSKPNTIIACVKHFAAYGAPQAGRDYNTVDISDRSLFEWYLPPYKAAVEAGAASAMTSFNEISGIPSTSNKWLVNGLLRKQWGFKGFVVSDYTGIDELVPHGVAANLEHAAQLAINAGVDMDMQGETYQKNLIDLVNTGKVSLNTLNSAVKNILIAKYRLGLFDDPYRYCDKNREKTEIMTPGNLAFARKMVSKSCVLLKNENQTLPVNKNIKKIAVIGPLADSKVDMLGNWSAAGEWNQCVTLLEGVKNAVSVDTKVMYAKGCDVTSGKDSDIVKALSVAKDADYIILALGESGSMSGEASSRSNIGLPGNQLELARAISKIGKPFAVALFNGRPLAIPELDSISPAILETWFGGTQAGNGIADVLFGDVCPSGKLTMTFPRSVGQVPIFYNHKNTGRPFDASHPADKYKSRYIDVPNDPLYPFGFGLSYTHFTYSPISMEKSEYHPGEKINASVNIVNSGNYDGEEVVQLYVHALLGEVTRPVEELKGFKKIFLKKGEILNVNFILDPKDLGYYHSDMSFTTDKGEYELLIGTNSADTQKIKFIIR